MRSSVWIKIPVPGAKYYKLTSVGASLGHGFNSSNIGEGTPDLVAWKDFSENERDALVDFWNAGGIISKEEWDNSYGISYPKPLIKQLIKEGYIEESFSHIAPEYCRKIE